MKPKTNPTPHPAKGRTKARVRKARVYYCDSPSGIYLDLQGYRVTDRHYPVSVTPHPTQRQALAAVRWANYTEEQKLVELYECICSHPKKDVARAVLQLLTGGGTGGGR